VILPVVSKGDSPAYRAEAICALLEREIGVVAILAQQFLVIEVELDGM
jgi:hypothetical protein